MNGLTAAQGLRRSVENAGGLMRISVPALGDAFGRGKMTARAKTGIEGVLAKAGVQVIPGLNDPSNDGWVTLRTPAPVSAGAPAPPAPALTAVSAPALGGLPADGADSTPALPPAGRRQLQPAGFLAAAVAFLVPLLLVIALASPDAGRPGRADAAGTETTAVTAPTPGEQAHDALLAGDYRQAIALMRQADPAGVPATRAQVVAALLTQARQAQQEKAYVRAIRLARRAARFGRAPDAARIVVQSRAGLDLRREQQRRSARSATATTG